MLVSNRSSRIGKAILALAAGLAALAHASTIPMESTGNLGSLSVQTGTVLFNTDTGIYYVNGVAQDTSADALAWGFPANNGGNGNAAYLLPVFNFTSVDLGSSVVVQAVGGSPLVLLATMDANLGATFMLDGANGGNGAPGAGGGGGAGGGALGVFADGSVNFTGSVFANGGNGGLSELLGGDPSGGLSGLGFAGAGSGGLGGDPSAGGRGGAGGSAPVIGTKNATGSIGIGSLGTTQYLYSGGGGGGGGGGGYFGKKGTGGIGMPGGFDGQPGASASCKDPGPGGDGGGGGNMAGNNGLGGTRDKNGDPKDYGVATGPGGGSNGNLDGIGGGGGLGGDAPDGGDGSVGGDGGKGAGGGGGGGGGDSCDPNVPVGDGGDGGSGGGGTGKNGEGNDGQKGKQVSESPLPSGGAGGGGAILFGSKNDNVQYCGLIQAFGGTSSQSVGGNGELVIDSANVSTCINARFNGLALLDSQQTGYSQLNGLSSNDFNLSGGAGGGGAGGDGQNLPEPSTWIPVAAAGAALFVRRSVLHR